MYPITRLGLTGGIGSGKSTVAHLLQQLGAALIDADAISKQVTAPGGSAIDAIRLVFGPTFIAPDGSLQRNAMRQHILVDPAAKAQLEAIIHPAIACEITLQQQAARAANAPLIVMDIPLLVESARWRSQLDHVLVIDCSAATQVQRVMARPSSQHWTVDQIQGVMALQATRAQRLAAADTVICNDGIDLQTLQTQVRQTARRFGL